MKNFYEGGDEEKNEAGPLTDRPPAGDGGDEQLAEKEDPPAETELAPLPKAQDDSIAAPLDVSQAEQPLT